MSAVQQAGAESATAGLPVVHSSIAATVMSVLREIRPLRSDGGQYDETSGLTDAGFTSVEMVKVMLGVEAAFDLMIPQDMITPENFMDARSITAMIARLTVSA
jgi:acyl carrier protein